MKKIITLILLSNSSCRAQIYEELKGCWLPENYVYAPKMQKLNNLDTLLFPIEAFQIFSEDAKRFVVDYQNELEDKDTLNVTDFVLIKTYRSDFNGFHIEEIKLNGIIKYKIPFFYGGLNLKYVSRELVDRYKNSEVYFCRSGNKLMLEIKENGNRTVIYYINKIDNYVFRNLDDTRKHLGDK